MLCIRAAYDVMQFLSVRPSSCVLCYRYLVNKDSQYMAIVTMEDE